MPNNILFNYFSWYFVFVPKYLILILSRYTNYIDNKFAISVMLSYFFTPLFGDKTIIGFFLGVVFRFVRIVFGLTTLILFLINYLIVLVFWVVAPFIFLYHGLEYFFVFLLISFSLFIIKRMYLPTQHTHNINSPKDLIHSFTPSAKRIFSSLKGIDTNKQNFISLLLNTKEVNQMLLRLELSISSVEKLLISTFDINKQALMQSMFKYKDLAHFVRPNVIFLAIVDNNKKLQAELIKQNVSIVDIEDVYEWQIEDYIITHENHIWDIDYTAHKIGGLNRVWIARPTPRLDKVSEDITKTAQDRKRFPIYGKEKVINNIKNALAKNGRKNVLIIGSPGVGKSSVVYGLAEDIINGESLKQLRFKRIVRLESTKLLSLNDKKSEELLNIINEIESESNTILFLDDIHILSSLSVANSDKQSLFEYLLPYLEKGKLQVIGTISSKNYKDFIEPNVSFARLFEKFEVPEPTDKQVLKILQFQLIYSVKTYSIQALKGIIQLSRKYIKDRVLPDKAVQMIEILNSKDIDNIIYIDEVRQYITEATVIPITKVSIEESQNILNIESELNKIVIAQPRAITLVSNAIIRSRTAFRDESKPIASFLFAGPTGVGKTYLAKMLAKKMFGREDMLVRFDMSEFQNLDDTGNFINRICDAVNTRAYSVILIDELEKANQKLILTLLQVLDDARLTNINGEVSDFSQSVIIATTNIGNRVIDHLYALGNSDEQIETQAMKEIKNHFAPEFLNRFSDIIVFSPLSKVEVLKVVRLEVEKLVNRVKQDKKIEFTYTDAFIYYVANSSYSSEYGARPVYRFLEEEVQTNIAKLLLQGKISAGSTYDLDQLINKKDNSVNG